MEGHALTAQYTPDLKATMFALLTSVKEPNTLQLKEDAHNVDQVKLLELIKEDVNKVCRHVMEDKSDQEMVLLAHLADNILKLSPITYVAQIIAQ